MQAADADILEALPLRCGCAALRDGASDPAAASGAAPAALTPYFVSALLPWPPERLDSGTLGTPATITYSFLNAPPGNAGFDDRNGFAAMSPTQRAAVRQSLTAWAEVARIGFVETADAPSVLMRLGTNDQNGVSSGYAYLPSSSRGGTVYIANDYAENISPSAGSFGFLTLTHEIGHALGLKHPGNYNAGGGGVQGPFLPGGEDNYLYSVMSYHRNPDMAALPVGPSLYDIAAIQHLYGANTATRAGADTYVLGAGGQGFRTIWDGGGIDTIDASQQGEAARIDLRPAMVSFVGSRAAAVVAFATTIENAVGGAGNDTLISNAADNRLDGRGGDDIAVFAQAQGAYGVCRLPNDTYLVTGPEGRDLLTGIERLQFGAAAPVPVAGAVTSTFDPLSYIAANPDLGLAFGTNTAAATDHFVRFGIAENRPTEGFDALSYLAGNPDVADAIGLDPERARQHYLQYGLAERRTATGFDAFAYLASNPDLIAALGADRAAAARHYLTAGRREGRPTGGFDGLYYLASNPDLMAVFGADTAAATQHYVRNGQREGRRPRSFDALGYLASNADLAGAFGSNEAAAVRHYVSNGWREGRLATGFDAWRYLASNPDLIGAMGADTAAATRHYLDYGRAERRTSTGFNPLRYLQRNADVARALGSDQTAAVRHYVQYGYGERRNPGTNVAPAIAANDLTMVPYTSVAAPSLFTVTDRDGDAIQTYELRLASTVTGAYLMSNGVSQYGRTVSVAAGSLGTVALSSGGASSGSDQLQVRAYDGYDWSDWKAITVRVATPADNAGNSIATARVVGSLSATAQSFTDWVGSVDTDDYYRIQGTAGQVLSATVSELTGSASLDLYSAAGLRIAGASGNTLRSTLTATAAYYVRVSGYGAASYTLTLSAAAGATADTGMLAAG
ncbi:M10 family metallopeptidase C-terminal domain-containing protein [Azospirillum sp.]|uniref:M10 family metallopeptidase C-terminal domain-containing protein n=1 Tax=Azospirillum sp. TaxID=34012 RepID=UPI003D75248D